MKRAEIDSELRRELARRGFRHLADSKSRKIVLDFQRSRKSVSIFNSFCNKPIMRVFAHLLSRDMLEHALTLDEASQILSKEVLLKESLSESPDKDIFCRKCNEILYAYNIYEGRKPLEMKCPKCHTRNILAECQEKDNWTLPRETIKDYLDDLSRCGFCSSKPLGICSKCIILQEIELPPFQKIKKCSLSKTNMKNSLLQFFCRKCGKLYDIAEAYFIEDDVRGIWKENGTWLEWYLKNIVAKQLPSAHLEQGLVLIDDKGALEVDVLLLKDGKIISFECKAKKPNKKASFEEVSDVLKLLDFSDKVFLVTTGRVKENDKAYLRKLGKGKLLIVEGPGLEKFSFEAA